MKVYCDLDGVLVDFLRGIHKVFKIDYHYDKYPYELGKWNMFSDMMKPEIPIEVISAVCTQRFWEELYWGPDGQTIYYKIMSSFDDVYLLTTPMPNEGSWPGKYRWVLNNLGPVVAKKLIITTTSKSIVAGPDTLLIDDRDKNVEEFREAGGDAILVARPWNRLSFMKHQTYNFLCNCIDNRIKEAIHER